MESDHQSDETTRRMLKSVVRVLRRIRPAPAAAVDPPHARLEGDLRAAGLTPSAWAEGLRADRRLYVDLDHAAVEAARLRCPRESAATVALAEKFLEHEFDLLGSGPFVPVDPDRSTGNGYRPIDWRLDPIRRLRFRGDVPYKQWDLYTMRPGDADIKLPWELARAQHLVTLGQAFRLTEDGRYAREIADVIRDFVEANPVGIGIHWTCTMDVALRAVSWAFALALVRQSAAIDAAECAWLCERLFEHGSFIERNLENTYEVTSNHFLSNVVGLHVLASVFRDLPSGERWRLQTRDWLEQEMRTQVLDDGADYESSIPYHRLVAELFLGSARLARLNGAPLSAAYEQKLQKMIAFLAGVTRPDGLMPVVGDADDGRLHILQWAGWRPQDGRHLVAVAGAMFDRDDWRAMAGDGYEWEARWWGFDPPGRAATAASRPEVEVFNRARIVVLRSPDAWLLASNGPVGTAGFGNHKHNDQLSFEYHWRGAPVVVDPGSYVYTSDPDARNMFRSTAYHNTVSIVGAEQNEFKPEWLFRMFASPHEHALALDASACGGRLTATGRRVGFTTGDAPLTHERTWTIEPASGALAIRDRLHGATGRRQYRVGWHFHFAPGVHVEASGAGAGAFTVFSQANALTFRTDASLEARVSDAWYSPSYGVRLPCLAVDCSAELQRIAGQPISFALVPVP
jgi:hypothetical protein